MTNPRHAYESNETNRLTKKGLISVIVPVFNEEKTILSVIERLKAVSNTMLEIVVVDDGSNDKTWEVILAIEGIVALRHDKNQGKGVAIRTALPHTSGEAVIIQDADLEYYPEEIPLVVFPILDGKADVVYGSRFLQRRMPKGMRWPHWLANRLLANVAAVLYRQRISDVCTCYKAFRGDLIREMPLTCRRFEFCMEVTARFRKRGMHIMEVPISYEARSKQGGKKIGLSDAVIMMWSLIKHRFGD